MELVKILIVFVVILVLLNLKFPLYAGMLAGTALLLPLFQIGLPKAAEITLYSVTSAETLNMVLALYVISVLQLCLEKRDHLSRAQDAMNGLLSDHRPGQRLYRNDARRPGSDHMRRYDGQYGW